METAETSNAKKNSLKVAVLGATGKVGQHFVQQALNAGHSLRMLVRDETKLPQQIQNQCKIVVGDSTQLKDVAKIVEGSDVVVSSLGNVGKTRILKTSFKNILTAATSQAKVPRCVFVSSIGCGGTSWFIKMVLILITGKAGFNDYETADMRVCDEKTVPCTLVRPTVLNDKPGVGKYKITENKSGTFLKSIAREDVAKFLCNALINKNWDGKPGILLSRYS